MLRESSQERRATECWIVATGCWIGVQSRVLTLALLVKMVVWTLNCQIVGVAGMISVPIDSKKAVFALKMAIKATAPHLIRHDADQLKLFLPTSRTNRSHKWEFKIKHDSDRLMHRQECEEMKDRQRLDEFACFADGFLPAVGELHVLVQRPKWDQDRIWVLQGELLHLYGAIARRSSDRLLSMSTHRRQGPRTDLGLRLPCACAGDAGTDCVFCTRLARRGAKIVTISKTRLDRRRRRRDRAATVLCLSHCCGYAERALSPRGTGL